MGGGLAGRGVAPLLAILILGAAGPAAAQAPAVPPGLRPAPAPPGTLRPPNFIAIPTAPEPFQAVEPSPPPQPPAVVRAPRPTPAPTPVAETEEAGSIGLPIRRAVIHHLGGRAVVDALRAAGHLRRLADTIEMRVVDDVPAVPSIRYFYEEDAGAARVTAVALEESGQFQIRGFPEYRPRPRPGLIEVWLPRP